ncbi:hypothetical protein [Pantoea dispersa]|uniref:hypothetical protein n=1 Tax=Pantoea dispersa TaxID=59814 RepID=UPI00286B8639|nr:hypothetical protein [Pantoea dispersa]
MVHPLLFAGNDILIGGKSFKKHAKASQRLLKENHGIDISLGQMHEISAVGFGFASFHEMRLAAQAATDALKPLEDPHEKLRREITVSLDKRAAWVNDVSPKKLLAKRSPRWIETALRVTDRQAWMTGRLNVRKANITLVVGQDSSLVLKALSAVYKNPRYYSLKHGATLEQVYQDVAQDIAAHQRAYDIAASEGKLIGTIGGKRGMATGVYHCIAGLAEIPLTAEVISQLVRISELDPGMRMAINIERTDLLKFSSPDLNAPHFHSLTVIDLDRINDEVPLLSAETYGDYPQPNIWRLG